MLETRGLIHILVCPRQTGESTASRQAMEGLSPPISSVPADFGDVGWLRTEWQQARNLAEAKGETLFIVDEVQRIDG